MKKILALALLALGTTAHAQTFTQAYTTSAVSNQGGTIMTSGDLRGKGYADIVVIQNGQICVLQNNGDATFSAPSCSGSGVLGFALADSDNNGSPNFVAITQNKIFLNGLSGGASDAPPTTGGGIYSGPFVGDFENDASSAIVFGAQHCTSIVSTTLAAIAFGGGQSGTGVHVDNVPDCTGRITGAINTAAGSFVLVHQAVGGYIYNVNVGAKPYAFCSNTSIGIGSYALSFDSTGNFCVQQIQQVPPSAAVLATGHFTLTGDQSVASIVPITLSDDFGLLAIITSPTSPTSLQLVHGTDVLHLTQTGGIAASLHNPSLSVADIFRPTGVAGQDVAVLDQNGLTVFVQSLFSGAFNAPSVNLATDFATSTTNQLTYTNTGTAALAPLVISVAGSPDFTQTNDCPPSLAAGDACHVTVIFVPGTVETTSTATLTAASTRTTQTVNLNGLENPFIDPVLDQTSFVFSNQLVGTTSPAHQFKLTNNGNAVMSATTSVTGQFFLASNTCASVVPSAFCTISINFVPTSPNLQNGTVTIHFASHADLHITLSGTATIGPSITTQPTDQTVVLGNAATFTVATTGTAPLTYAWTKGGVAIGGNSSTLTFAPLVGDNGASIAVKVTNAFGSVTSQGAILHVLFAPIVTGPSNVAVTLGQSATFTVVATGTAPFTYSWMKNGIAIANTNSPTYTTPPVVAGDSGAHFSVKVTNSIGQTTSGDGILGVDLPPSITAQPTDQSVLLGTSAAFAVTAQGTNLSYQWERGGNPIVGATQATLSFVPLVADDGAKFNVVVSDPFGPSVTSTTATLTIHTPLTITSQSTPSVSMSVGVGSTATFSFTITGIPAPTIQWFKGATAIPGANAATYTTPVLLASDDTSTYHATATNPYDTVTTKTFEVFVIPPPVVDSQKIISGTLTSPFGITINPGSSFILDVVAHSTHDSVTTFEVFKNGVAISSSIQTAIATPNFEYNIFGNSLASTADSGAYVVQVSNIGGTVQTSPMTLTVVPSGFSLSLTPPTQTIKAGATAQYQLNVTTSLVGVVDLTCSVPSGLTCSLSAAQTSNGAVTVSVGTTASATTWPWFIGLFTALGLALATHPRLRRLVLVPVPVLALLLFSVGCGGGSSASPSITPTTPTTPTTPSTTSKTYQVVVTGTFQTGTPQPLTEAVNATLVVQ